MEIKDYLRILGRRLRILVLVPAAAFVLVAGAILVRPPHHRATATVAAPALVGGATANQYSGANGLRAFVANFTATLTSPRILEQVASGTGVPKDRVKSGLSATQEGGSSVINVTYTTTRRSEAARVVRAAASDTILFLFSSQVALAQQPVDSARKAVDEAEGAITELIDKVGSVPDKAYEIKSQEISRLRQLAVEAGALGNTGAAARYQAAADTRQAELRQLAPQVQSYQALVDRKNQAISVLNQAQQSLQQARAQLQAADPAQVVTVSRTESVPILPALIRGGATALAVGLFLAVGIVIVLELLTPAGAVVGSRVARRAAASQA